MKHTVRAVAAGVCLALAPGITGAQDFGAPPAGPVPILFNDHHVYARPDELRKGRVLAALIQNNQILVPLRSLFEQFGATVGYERSTQAATIAKGSSTIVVTVGKNEVDIDGATRPLDVPPEIVDGEILVPVRVIIEALGGYVQYVPSIKVVVIRYTPPQPVALAPETPVEPAPAATPLPRPHVPPGPPIPVAPPGPETFVSIDDNYASKVTNSLASSRTVDATRSFAIHGAAEFNLVGQDFVFGGDAERYVYGVPERPEVSPVGPVGPVTTAPIPLDAVVAGVPTFVAQDVDWQVFFGPQLAPAPRHVSLGIAYTRQGTNYGFPAVGGAGIGLSKLPNFPNRISWEAAIYYFPNLTGAGTIDSQPKTISYSAFDYRVGLTASLLKPLFIEATYAGRTDHRKSAPASINEHGPELGVGLHF